MPVTLEYLPRVSLSLRLRQIYVQDRAQPRRDRDSVTLILPPLQPHMDTGTSLSCTNVQIETQVVHCFEDDKTDGGTRVEELAAYFSTNNVHSGRTEFRLVVQNLHQMHQLSPICAEKSCHNFLFISAVCDPNR